MRALAVVLLTVLGACVFPGCGSDTSSSTSNGLDSKDAGKDGGACNVAFCPSVGTGRACCVGKQCGLDYGMGCVASTNDAGH